MKHTNHNYRILSVCMSEMRLRETWRLTFQTTEPFHSASFALDPDRLKICQTSRVECVNQYVKVCMPGGALPEDAKIKLLNLQSATCHSLPWSGTWNTHSLLAWSCDTSFRLSKTKYCLNAIPKKWKLNVLGTTPAPKYHLRRGDASSRFVKQWCVWEYLWGHLPGDACMLRSCNYPWG